MIKYIIYIIVIGIIAIILSDFDIIVRKYYPKPGFDVSMIPDQSGKVIIVTGGTTGVGRSSAEQLCLKGAKIIIVTSRSQSSADKAAKEIQEQYCLKTVGTKVIGKALSLEDHKSIQDFSKWFISLNEPLHVLMLNAGLSSSSLQKTSLGLEKTIGSNWFGHFYLQHLLQDIVEKSAPSRIVIVSSKGCNLPPPITNSLDEYILFELQKEAKFEHYGLSKLFNVYHAYELHRQLRERGINNVYVNSLHPGIVKTNIGANMINKSDGTTTFYDIYNHLSKINYPGSRLVYLVFFLADYFGLEPLEGALTQLYAATSPDIENQNISGEYFYPIALRENNSIWNLGASSNLNPQARDKELAKKVWQYGESLIAKIPKDQ